MNDPRPTLRRARALLAEPGRWTQGAPARTAGGSECGALDPDAHAFCMVGALACADDDRSGRYSEGAAYQHVLNIIGDYHEPDEFDSVEMWNDDPCTSQDAVLALLDEAIRTRPHGLER